MRFSPTKKQLTAIKRGLTRSSLKLPRPGYCVIMTRKGGKPSRLVASSHDGTSEICHDGKGANGRHKYIVRASRPIYGARKRRRK